MSRRKSFEYPPLRGKMTKIIIGYIAATKAALKALRFPTQAMVGEIVTDACLPTNYNFRHFTAEWWIR
jgi:hypothetical protein